MLGEALLETRFQVAQRRYSGKIRAFANLHYTEIPGSTSEDLQQELLVVLWNVVCNYNPDSGARFNTYFWQCVRNHYVSLVRRAHAEKRKSEWFDLYSVTQDGAELTCASLETLATPALSAEALYCLQETIVERRKEAVA